MNKFDWKYYISKYPDLAEKDIDSKIKAVNHFKKYGLKEGRFPNKEYEKKKVINNSKNENNNIPNNNMSKNNISENVFFKKLDNKLNVIPDMKINDQNNLNKHSDKIINSSSNDENFFKEINNNLDKSNLTYSDNLDEKFDDLSYSDNEVDEIQKIKNDIKDLNSKFNKINTLLNNLTKESFSNKNSSRTSQLDSIENRIVSSEEYSLDENDNIVSYSN